jgi:hypothetical protein
MLVTVCYSEFQLAYWHAGDQLLETLPALVFAGLIREGQLASLSISALCREGLFLLPYDELAVAQGPKIYQKNEL